MSLKPNFIVQNPFFYPTGNTQAACLTQNLPPDRDATILSLGCGDVRNILFTVYAGAGLDGRTIDITCCDLDAEIMARNIVAFTLIVDDKHGAHTHLLWNVYYHIFLDAESLSYVQKHAKKLLTYARSVDSWNAGPFGSRIRFCDTTTLENVAKLWKIYAIDPDQTKEYKAMQQNLKNEWKRVQRVKNELHGNDLQQNGVRAAAPLFTEAFDDTRKQHRAFWQTGSTLTDKKVLGKLNNANPMFACVRSALTLHYGTDPLLGFHLATSYAQLSADSPMKVTDSASEKALPKTLATALHQFGLWCEAFRKASPQCTIRVVHADAIAFCHVLNHHRTHGESRSANWYRSSWEYSLLTLESPDYAGGVAPTSFNVIDTSNLIDHLGSLNVLAAAAPLLTPEPFSTMRTEMMVPRELSVIDSAQVLLCGDLPTIASLFGLRPVQYWTNATATWHINESRLRTIPNCETIGQLLSRHVVLWKPADTSIIKHQIPNLAMMVYNTYLEMFADENVMSKFQMLGKVSPQLLLRKINSYELYTRASLAVILQRICKAGGVNRDLFINEVVDWILDDPNLMMGAHNFQALITHLHMFKLSALEKCKRFHPASYRQDLRGPFSAWTTIPAVVCITLSVPRSVVAMFGDISKGNGTPICHLMLQSSVSMNQNIYSDIQLGFGTVVTSGAPFSDSYSIEVVKDDRGWDGDTPFVVSAMVSTWSLVDRGDPSCRVIFALKSTPASMKRFAQKLGMFLTLHESAVGKKDVFVTKHRPNTSGHNSIDCTTIPRDKNVTDIDTYIQPCIAYNRIVSLTTHFDLIRREHTALLQSDAQVEFTLPDPTTLVLNIGGRALHQIELPIPLNGAKGRGKVARKSSWIEYTAPLADTVMIAIRPDSVFPAKISRRGDISLDHLHYVHPSVLPILHVGKEITQAHWIARHSSTLATMSAPDHAIYEKYLQFSSLNKPGRLALKESIFTIIMHVLGLEGREKSVTFGLVTGANIPGHSARIATVFVDHIRMDLSNQTLLLDAAVLSLHSGQPAEFGHALAALRDVQTVILKVDDSEGPFWRQLLPLFAERCREWKHKPTCEYRSTGTIPLSTEPGKRYMCNCGSGFFPKGYLKSIKPFQKVAKYAVRVAIPVIFSSPISNEDGSGFPLPPMNKQVKAPTSSHDGRTSLRLNDLDAKKGTCFGCGAREAKKGGVLMKCARCKFAQYCSAECQTKSWKEEHKALCKQLEAINGE
ncbi:hypothetical protein K458DRAFT_480637 [Lentithecium fluviatile CBS 122367]|uniref:MYND-type domain-containing protein n=1 Tax=Lentithecium fluviatile CBS 122367 TaxID=1168545 RepID=A0A6G1ILF3_9PLEO|nr:hypothetical protein K458DRAFT_480637 [Lentithecium fluviatile CBS 122367]